MKKNLKKRISSLFTIAVIGIQGLVSGVSPIIAHADTVDATVTYSMADLSNASGTRNGQPFTTQLARLRANGEDVFCLQPGVAIPTEVTQGYVGKPDSGHIPRRSKLASALWKTALGGDSLENYKVAQTVYWNNLEGSNKTTITHDSSISDSVLASKQKKLEDAITAYDLKPSFNQTTVKLKYGESTIVKNTTSGIDLTSFDVLVGNTANVKVDIQKDQLVITPNDLSKNSGTLTFKKSFAEGTPYVYEKEGNQTVASGKINDPNNYLLKFDIDTTGDVKIVKVDKDSGDTVPKTKFHVEFSGEGAPKEQDIETGKDGSYTFKDIKAGVKVKATETFVPSPYVLESATGGSDTVEGVVKVGETITLTKRNTKAKGQIIVEKTGVETGNSLWNSNYTLKGNVFEVHKNSVDGEVVKTITTDEKGHAETSKDLDIGTYWVTEKQASQGFANTFKPVEVKIKYANQTTAVVVEGTKGTNQEVTGATTLTKEDAETGKETQGRATFEGAEYTLYYSDGEKADQPVKWSDDFKPVLTVGDKANEENVTIRINSQSLQAGVKHLALGNFYWLETKAPEGYQIDKSKHNVSLTYKDQNTQVVTSDVASKENVIKFTLDGFKYVTSKNGSAQSGYNGIKFTLTPLDPTKGEKVESITETNELGYDGYWNFTDNPYGDYKLEEVEAPEGFKLIEPLIINSSFDSTNKEYKFTITEEGQKNPIKTLTVPESKINDGSNVVNLSKLFLYDDSVQEPEKPTIETLFVTTDGEKEFDPTKDQKLIDKVTNTVDKTDVGQELFYVTQFHKVTVDENGKLVTDKDGKIVNEVVGEIESTQKASDKKFDFDVEFDYKANTLKNNERLVATHIVYKDKEHTEEYAKHFDLENEKQTLVAKAPEQEKPTIETLFVTTDGEKEFDPTKDQKLIDKVTNTVDQSDVGQELFYVTQFHKVTVDENGKLLTDKDGKIVNEVVGEIESTQKASDKKFDFDVEFDYKANTLKDNERLVATHIVYKDKEHKEEYAKHFDLENEKQTLVAKVPEQEKPAIETLFVTKEDGKEFDPTKDQELIDHVTQTIPESDIGKEVFYVTQFHKVTVDENGKLLTDKDGKIVNEVVGEIESAHTSKTKEDKFDVKFNYKANTLKNGEKLVATHIAYKDKEHKEEYAKHFDLENEKQTLTAKVPTEEKVLPMTGEELTKLSLIGIVGMVGLSVAFYLRERNSKKEIK